MNVADVACTGCGGCLTACKYGCISMTKDQEGFFKAAVNPEQCIDCGACLQVCSSLRKCSSEKRPLAYFAAYAENDKIRNSSTSGGIFSSLASDLLEMGGVVYGAAFTQDFRLSHIRITDVDDLWKLRGSKYLQSDAFSSYESAEKDLQSGKTVLFSGTPCQIYGLKQYLGCVPSNLITIDLICHGVPSPELFNGYRLMLERKMHAAIEQFYFRSKEQANDDISYTVKLSVKKGGQKKDVYISGDEDPYMLRFLSGALQNICCYSCAFADLDRVGDITLGDYWGYQDVHSEIESTIKGVSLVLINTSGGKAFFEKARGITSIPSSEEKALRKNNHLYEPTKKHTERDAIYKSFLKNGFDRFFFYQHFLPKGYFFYLLKRRIKKVLHR